MELSHTKQILTPLGTVLARAQAPTKGVPASLREFGYTVQDYTKEDQRSGSARKYW
jgi:hypothetical protein